MIVRMELKVSGAPLPDQVTDREAMEAIGLAIRTLIIKRTLNGISATGKAFKGYSTKRIWVPFSDRPGTGRRLTPKGGVVSRTGLSMRFDDGYAEYKRKSRRAGQIPEGGAASAPTAEVDLVLSGQLLRSIEVAQADDTSVVVQTGNGTLAYADKVNEERPFMGIAPDDIGPLERVIARHIQAALRRKGLA